MCEKKKRAGGCTRRDDTRTARTTHARQRAISVPNDNTHGQTGTAARPANLRRQSANSSSKAAAAAAAAAASARSGRRRDDTHAHTHTYTRTHVHGAHTNTHTRARVRSCLAHTAARAHTLSLARSFSGARVSHFSLARRVWARRRRRRRRARAPRPAGRLRADRRRHLSSRERLPKHTDNGPAGGGRRHRAHAPGGARRVYI